MSVIVQKYGGSSLDGIDKIKKVASLVAGVKEAGHQVAVVVSAMGETTDALIESVNKLSSDPPGREMDMLLSTGERISMSLLCIALGELGVKAVSLTGSQAGIITNDRHTDARVMEIRPFRIQDELESGNVVVIGGFQGVSYKRDITTLGRGGSDTSAVSLAAALNAERCEIYSDIDGVYSADPSLIKDAKHLPEISYQQMQEMSMAGAKVLNAQAVQFAKEARITIYARSTFNPGKETIVRMLQPEPQNGVKAVVYENDVIKVSIKLDPGEDIQTLLDFLEQFQVPIKELNYTAPEEGISKISFVLSAKNIIGWNKRKNELSNKYNNKILFIEKLSAISLIGEGLTRDNTILQTALQLLTDFNIKYYGITTTSFRISLLIEQAQLIQCINLFHNKWITEGTSKEEKNNSQIE
ncbi:MAG: aspartate kinase [Ignavibacteriales bacterium]|nr:MAG: aspartate kinase [Ignavibacteriales bacterium]